MGYQLLNLPPRYVQQISHSAPRKALSATVDSENHIRKVHFHDDANHTILVQPMEKLDLWYSPLDFSKFRKEYEKNEGAVMTTPRKRRRRLILGQRPTPPPLEQFQTFRDKECQNRRRLVKTLLEHQELCREKGFYDPDGCYLLSKALSRNDRKFAWQAAAVNAYEVEGFRKPMHSMTLASLLTDYYWSSIHPYMNDPLSYLAKVLQCQCD